jgi:pentatricopeptide repeat protein
MQCNTVLSTLGRAEQCDAAAALFQDMTLNGPSPDKVTNQTMVSVFERVYRYEEAAVFRSILNMAPAIVRTGKGQAHVQAQGQGQVPPLTKIEKKSISSSKMNNKANDDDKIPSQISILNGSDDIISDSTAATVKTDDQNDVLSYVQNDPTPLEDYYPDMIRLSPAGTLKDKLLADGRRVGKKKKEEFPLKGLEGIVSTARTDSTVRADSDVRTNDENEKVKKVRSKKISVEIKKSSGEEVVGEGIEGVEKVKSKVKTTGKEKVQKGEKGEKNSSRNEGKEGEEGGVEGGDMKWEKGGGGAAAMIRLLGIAGKTTEALELFLSLEKEGEKGSVPLPTSLYNAASKCMWRFI